MTCFPAPLPNGEYPLESIPKPWIYATVEFNDESRTEIIDTRDSRRYLHEPMRIVAFKCLTLFLFALPIYMTIYSVIHLLRLPVVACMHRSADAVVEQILTIVQIPFYWIALEFSALYGIFFPLDGRAFFAHFESRLHGEKKRSEALNTKANLKVGEECQKAICIEKNLNTFYLAFCFQPYGKKANDSRIKVLPLEGV